MSAGDAVVVGATSGAVPGGALAGVVMPSVALSLRAPRCGARLFLSAPHSFSLLSKVAGHWEGRRGASGGMAPGGGVALQLRQRVTGGATGAVALLPRAAGDAVDVAYPSGEVVVFSEVSASGALSDAPVVLRPGAEDGETTASGSGRIVCAWAPGEERRGLLAVGAHGAVHLYAPSHASGDANVGDAWMRVDRIALDADATALTWTDDGEAIAVATSSGFVGAFEWHVAKWEPPTTGEEASPSSSPSSDNAEWRRRGRAPVAQELIAAGTSTAAAIITAGTGSRRAFLWRCGGDATRGTRREGRETLTHPAPVVDASIVNSQSTRPPLSSDRALTVAADGAVRLWTTAHRGAIGGSHHERDTMRQALVIQTHGPDLFAAKWLSVTGGEYVVGVSRDGYVRAWRVVGAEGSNLGQGLTIPRAHLWTTVRISSGGYERVNAGNASWTCEPVGVSGRTARIRFASVEAGTSFRDVRLDEPRFQKDDDADADDDDADASASASFIGHGARVTRVICSVCAKSGDSTVVTADDAGGALAWRVTAAGTLTPTGNARDEIRTAAVHTHEPTDTHVGIHEGVPSDAVAVAPAPFGDVLAVAFADGKVAVYEAESTYPCGTFTLESEIISHGDETLSSSISEPVMLRWFDAGAGCLLLATCAGPAVSVYARVPGNDFGVHSSRSSVTSPWTMLRHRLFHENVSACAWTARGESLVVGVGREVLALGSGAGLAMALATEAAPAREYHPSVLLDWLARGEVGRARLAARHVLEHLRAIGDGEAVASRGGLAPVPIAELVAEGDRVESRAEANVPIDSGSSSAAQSSEHDVPEFDANAFGGFAGFAPAPSKPKPLFAFGQDLPAADDEKTAGAERTAPGRRVRAPVRHERFSAAEAEEGAELVAAHGDVLLDLGSDGRMALLGALDALVDADGGTDSYGQIDEAGRRFRMLSRERQLRSHRDEGRLDAYGPRGMELAWALQCDTQDALLSSVLNDESNKAWKDLRRLGVPLWLRDTGELHRLVDAAARAEFAATRDPGGENPCALLYAALGRTSVLAGLFKASRETRLAEFLSRNFAEDRHREAALKNAYALMSKRRYSFAAAFFVLAGQHADAAALVWRRLGDLSLAVTVARFAPADANTSNPSVDTGAPFTRVGSARNDAGIVSGGGASDDGMISMDAFAGFGAMDGGSSTANASEGRVNAAAVDPRTADAEAPLPASLPPLVKDFLRREVVPSFEGDGWTLAAVRWMCGDGREAVTTLSSLASSADLCRFISARKALRRVAPRLADAAADAARAGTVRLILALERCGMPLAALERCGGDAESGGFLRGRLAAAAALAAEACSSLNPESRVRECIDALQRHVAVPVAEVRESLMRRRELAMRAAANVDFDSNGDDDLNVDDDSARAAAAPSLGSPRFATLERIRVGGTKRRVSNEDRTPMSPTTPSPRASHGGNFLQSGFDVFVNTSFTPTKPAGPAPSIRALRTPLEIAKLTGDAFYGACLNPAAPHQLGLAAVKKGLVVADLRQLGADADVNGRAALESAAAVPRDATLWSGGGMNTWPNESWWAPGGREVDERMPGVGPRRVPDPVYPIFHGGGSMYPSGDWSTAAAAAARAVEESSPSKTPERTRWTTREASTDVPARCVASHPLHPILLAGAAAGTAVLWRFDEDADDDGGRAGEVAIPRAKDGSPVTAVPWSPGTGAGFAIGGWNGDLCAFRSDGDLGKPSSHWTPQYKDSRVEALTYLSPMTIAAVGKNLCATEYDDGVGASVMLWDTLCASRPAGAFSPHDGSATAVTTLAGWDAGCGAGPWPLVATAGRNGDVAAHDLRLLGGSADGARSVLWRSCGRSGGDGHSAKVTALASVGSRGGSRGLLVSGCKDGDVRVWRGDTGDHVQRVHGAHERHTFVAPRGGGQNMVYVGVSDIVALEDAGVLTCGGDGTVKLFRLTNEAFGLAGEGGA